MDSKAFFQAVLDSSIPRSAGRLVLVTHIVPGSENFVLGIPLHGPTCRVIEELVPVIHYTRDMIASASPGGHRHVLQVNAQGNRFFLCNEGKSANFMHGGVVGPFIDLVQAELLFALSRIGDAPRGRVVELCDDAAGGGSVSDIALKPAAFRPQGAACALAARQPGFSGLSRWDGRACGPAA